MLQSTINRARGAFQTMNAGQEKTMAASKSAVAVVSEEKIRQIAHQLWMESGQPEGQAEDHWFKAIELASAKAAKKAASKPAAAKPAAAKPAAAKPAAKAAAPKKTAAAKKSM
jgi:hypothetical protein